MPNIILPHAVKQPGMLGMLPSLDNHWHPAPTHRQYLSDDNWFVEDVCMYTRTMITDSRVLRRTQDIHKSTVCTLGTHYINAII